MGLKINMCDLLCVGYALGTTYRRIIMITCVACRKIKFFFWADCCDDAINWYLNHSAQIRDGVIVTATRKRIDGVTSMWGSPSARGYFLIMPADCVNGWCIVGDADLDWFIPA